jgi:hypothetical protein
MIVVRPHLNSWYVWRDSHHVATITCTQGRYTLHTTSGKPLATSRYFHRTKSYAKTRFR